MEMAILIVLVIVFFPALAFAARVLFRTVGKLVLPVLVLLGLLAVASLMANAAGL